MIFNTIITFVLISNLQIVTIHMQNTLQNRKDLIEIIKSLNNPKAEEIIDEANKNIAGYPKELTDEAKEKVLQEVLKLIKKNYNANIQHEKMMKNPSNTNRLYFIRNPEALDEYKNFLRDREDSSSSSGDISSGERVTKFSAWRNIKRRTDSKLDSVELDTNDDKDETKTDETIDNDKTTEIKADILSHEDVPNSLELTKENEKSLDIQNKRAKDSEQSDNIVRREKIQWSDSNEKPKDIINKQKSLKINNKPPKPIQIKNSYNEDKVTFKPPKYEPKITYRKPKNDRYKDFLAFGRTSIPFIGKKGIYEDK